MLGWLRGGKKAGGDVAAGQALSPSSGDDFGHPSPSTSEAAPLPSASQMANQSRLYNPYDGLSMRMDRLAVDKLYQMPTTAEYVFTEEATRRRRTWSDNMAFYTACGWVGGGFAGGLYGVLEGSRVPADLRLDTTRLRLNRYINCVSQRGRAAANAIGVLGMMFGLGESLVKEFGESYVRVDYPGALDTMLAGAATGALFRSPRGPRQMTVAAGLGAAMGATLCGVRSFASWA